MLETIDMAALEAGGLDYSAVTKPPRIKELELEQVSGGKRKKTTQDDLLRLQCKTLRQQCKTLRQQKETLVLLELEINQLELSLSHTT